jgi:type II secretory pathway pseudopilin PulG
MGLGQGERGYAMAALLVGMSIMAVLMSAALPVWTHYTKREREEELIWRGQQYARAVALWQRKYANTYPPTVDVLVEQKFLRKKYKDPITNDDFQVVPAGAMPTAPGNRSPQRPVGQFTSVGKEVQAAGIQGVVSKSTATSIKVVNGRTKHNEWVFVPVVTAQRLQAPQLGPDGRPITPMNPGAMPPGGGATFTPLGGAPRRPDVGPPRPGQPPGQPSPFGQPAPFGPPSPFGQPSPFGPPRPPGPPPPRPPGN